jgi:hypothetical protein
VDKNEKKNLNLKKALSPVSETELQEASGGARSRYGCCQVSNRLGVYIADQCWAVKDCP